MKLVSVLASLLMVVPGAFAQSSQDVDTNEQIFELEEGPMSYEASQALTPPSMMTPDARRRDRDDERAGEIIGGIIGIIGAIAADRIDRDNGHDNYRRNVTCYARDRRGNVYRASGQVRRARQVQSRAVNKCERFARYCRPAGCHRH